MNRSTLQLEKYMVTLMTSFSFLALSHIYNLHITIFFFVRIVKLCISVFKQHLNFLVEGCNFILFFIIFFFVLEVEESIQEILETVLTLEPCFPFLIILNTPVFSVLIFFSLTCD